MRIKNSVAPVRKVASDDMFENDFEVQMQQAGPEDDELGDEDFDDGEDDNSTPGADNHDADLDGENDGAGDDGRDLDQARSPSEVGEAIEAIESGNNAPARAPSRGERRIEAALAARRSAEQEAANLRAELARDRAERERITREEQERNALANMEPEERAEYRIRQSEQRLEQRLQASEFRMADATDRTSFTAMCAGNPAVAAVAEQVEQTLVQLRNGGVNSPRETIAAYLIGQRAIERAGSARTRAGKAGAARIAANTTRPSNPRGNVARPPASTGGDTASARAKRLDGIEI